MSDTFDQADALNAIPLPVESASRHFVFLPNPADDPELRGAWIRWGGDSEFVTDDPAKCGICIFRRGSLGDNNALAALVKPFFDRHGSESNVFEFDPFSKDFWRVLPRWLETYYPNQ